MQGWFSLGGKQMTKSPTQGLKKLGTVIPAKIMHVHTPTIPAGRHYYPDMVLSLGEPPIPTEERFFLAFAEAIRKKARRLPMDWIPMRWWCTWVSCFEKIVARPVRGLPPKNSLFL
mmetsp:Transcript_14733/g.34071  ORF Transcript_14733/g.34071 Transcript_14733/m.34071 type:complete len:116 (+) Transcript_14733:309-656(+)